LRTHRIGILQRMRPPKDTTSGRRIVRNETQLIFIFGGLYLSPGVKRRARGSGRILGAQAQLALRLCTTSETAR
ncbi:hypothetical protein M9458_051540, partial [Cirrhinus mrigala]